MKYLRNHNLLLLVVGVLLVSNLALLWFFVWNKPEKPVRKFSASDARARLINEVGLTPEQTVLYDTLRKKHYSSLGPMFQDIRATRDSLFKMVHTASVNDSLINSLSLLVSEKQKTIDIKIHNYYRSLRDLCSSDEQKIKMDTFLIRLSRQVPWGSRRGNGPGQTKPSN